MSLEENKLFFNNDKIVGDVITRKKCFYHKNRGYYHKKTGNKDS